MESQSPRHCRRFWSGRQLPAFGTSGQSISDQKQESQKVINAEINPGGWISCL
jgi:hypothetical protein